jgi:hypothetical protein
LKKKWPEHLPRVNMLGDCFLCTRETNLEVTEQRPDSFYVGEPVRMMALLLQIGVAWKGGMYDGSDGGVW